MEILIHAKGIYFFGQIKDILGIFAKYPAETTLQELIRLHLN